MALTDEFRTPGQYIQWLMDERGWNQTVLSIVLEVGQTTISEIINGRRRVDAVLALALAEVFEVPVENFLTLQSEYDLATARIAAKPNPKRSSRAKLYSGLPISDMLKREWIHAESVKDVRTIEAELRRFFGVSSIDEIVIPAYAAKQTQASDDPTPAQLAWLYRVRQIASEMLVGKYSPEAVRAALPRLSALLLSREEVRKVPRILAECGIRFVIVEALPSSKIDGVCHWLDERSPVIGMSLRYDRIDNFWFVLRHEFEHVIQRHGVERRGQTSFGMVDTELEGARAGVGDDVSVEERVANGAAANFSVPAKTLKEFIARKAPFFAEQDLLSLASMLKVHPGLVAGQIRHATGDYKRFTNHLVKIRSVVTPSAVVDGWGDVAPV